MVCNELIDNLLHIYSKTAVNKYWYYKTVANVTHYCCDPKNLLSTVASNTTIEEPDRITTRAREIA